MKKPQNNAADEAGASDGASQLILVFDRTSIVQRPFREAAACIPAARRVSIATMRVRSGRARR
jgi:hypothetical protein